MRRGTVSRYRDRSDDDFLDYLETLRSELGADKWGFHRLKLSRPDAELTWILEAPL
jgi:hypothetical protein